MTTARDQETHTMSQDYSPSPEWLPTVFVKVARPGSHTVHIQTLFGPRRGGTGEPTTLCGRIKSTVDIQDPESYVPCHGCVMERQRIQRSEEPSEDASEYDRRDFAGRLRQAEHECEIYVAGQLHSSLAAKEISDRAYAQARTEAHHEAQSRRHEALRAETPVTALLAEAGRQAGVPGQLVDRFAAQVVNEARELGAEVTQVGEETVIRYPELAAWQAPDETLERTRAAWLRERQDGESPAAWYSRTRTRNSQGRYIPDPDPSEVPGFMDRAERLASGVPEWRSDTDYRASRDCTCGNWRNDQPHTAECRGSDIPIPPRAEALERTRAAWLSERQDGESISAWYLRTRTQPRRSYVPDPDPSEVPEWEDRDTESIQVGDWVYPDFNLRGRGWVVRIAGQDFPMAHLVRQDGSVWMALVERLRLADDAPEGPIPVPNVDLGHQDPVPPRAEALDIPVPPRAEVFPPPAEARNVPVNSEAYDRGVFFRPEAEGYVNRPGSFLSIDAHHGEPKVALEAPGRRAYAADYLGAPFIPGRTRVEHEGDRGNAGRVTRSEDPAVWVRWDDDPGHEYRYTAGELRQL